VQRIAFFSSSDATWPLGLAINFYGGTTGAERKVSLQGTEYGLSTSGLLLQPEGGNVGIGTTSPLSNARLHVQSANRYTGYFSSSTSTADTTCGIYGSAAGNGHGYGVYGQSTAWYAYGVYGSASGYSPATTYGVYGIASSGGYAGYFSGNVNVTGTLSKGSGTFKIDHPLDPANKYLQHSFVESPDMMNIYNGNVVLDGNGAAVVELPNWFEALNKDFRYQLTCIGGFAQVYIAEKVQNNRFKIAGGTPGLEVSWQVTGIRKDAYANAHRVQVETEKPLSERGKYLHPMEHGMTESAGIDYDNNHLK
jgi:hypothetical protein